MKKTTLFLGLIIGLVCFACNLSSSKQDENDILLATLNGKSLYFSEIKAIIPTGISPEDSLTLIKNYINSWARKYLIAEKAEEYLTKEQKNVSQELEDYRLALLSYRYETEYVAQKMDTTISLQEISEFYKQNESASLLLEPLAKIILIKVNTKNKRLNDIRRRYKVKNENEEQVLDSLCRIAKANIEYFNNEWMNSSKLQEITSMDNLALSSIFVYGKSWEKQIQDSSYFVYIKEVRNIGEQAPPEFAGKEVQDIILSRRKREFVKQLQNNVYNEALNYNRLKIYVQ